MAFIDIIKPFFLTGKKPNQTQFHSTFDYLRWKDEAIAQGDVTGLVAALSALMPKADYEGQLIEMDSAYTYTVPAGYELEKIIPFYGAGGAMQISTVAMGGTDETNVETVNAGWNRSIGLGIFAPVNTDVYIDGIPAGSKIVFIKRKIKMA